MTARPDDLADLARAVVHTADAAALLYRLSDQGGAWRHLAHHAQRVADDALLDFAIRTTLVASDAARLSALEHELATENAERMAYERTRTLLIDGATPPF